jgi:uncharacterized protein (TIGR00730 family)
MSQTRFPEKAYKNLEFLNSSGARTVRILAEYLEPDQRFRHQGIKDTIVFFGSSRVRPKGTWGAEAEKLRQELSADGGDSEELIRRIETFECRERLARFYDESVELAKRLTEWSKSLEDHAHRFIICSGGGPGIMEAANRGASEAAGLNIGLGISLPAEPGVNPYVSRELAFEFHYFFMRKFWFVYLAKALVVFPGGYGTLDELFELLTLVQTGTLRKPCPIVLYGTEYWDEVIDFDALARWGTIEPEHIRLFSKADDVETAFDYLTGELTRIHSLTKK